MREAVWGGRSRLGRKSFPRPRPAYPWTAAVAYQNSPAATEETHRWLNPLPRST